VLASDFLVDICCTIRPQSHAIFASLSLGVFPRVVEDFVAEFFGVAEILLKGLALHLAHSSFPVPGFKIPPVV